jgi:hypothetical protein
VNDTRLEGLVGNNGAVPAHFPADITLTLTLTLSKLFGPSPLRASTVC